MLLDLTVETELILLRACNLLALKLREVDANDKSAGSQKAKVEKESK